MQLNRSLGFWDVFAIALGQVIGSGIMVLVGIGIGFTGYGIVFAFMLSALLSIIKQIPVAFMGSAMPATGGLYVYCKRVLGPKIGFFYLAILACHAYSDRLVRARLCRICNVIDA